LENEKAGSEQRTDGRNMPTFVAKKVAESASCGCDEILPQSVPGWRLACRALEKENDDSGEDADCQKIIGRVHRHSSPIAKLTSSCALLIAAGLAMSGCQKKPEGQVIAIVNGEEVTARELEAEARATNFQGNDKASRDRLIQAVIDRKLLASSAVAQKLDANPDFQAQRQRMDEMALAQLALGTLASDTQAEANRSHFILEHPEMFDKNERLTLDVLRFAPADALNAQQISSIQSVDEAETLLRSKKVPTQRSTSEVQTATLPPGLAAKLSRLGTGKTFFINEGRQGSVGVITSRMLSPIPEQKQISLASEILNKQAAADAVEARVQELRSSAKIQYQNGYAPASAARREK
jgi:peptidyl-prolyl cis-trans isomerase C